MFILNQSFVLAIEVINAPAKAVALPVWCRQMPSCGISLC